MTPLAARLTVKLVANEEPAGELLPVAVFKFTLVLPAGQAFPDQATEAEVVLLLQ